MRISDTWRASTPAPLQKAIEHIRKTFDDGLWNATQSKDDCHEAITAQNRTLPEPEIFKRRWNSLAKSIHQLVEGAFTVLRAIASENHLEEPIEWATSQVRLMLEDEMLVEDIKVPRGATRLRSWIVTACDGADQGSPPTDKAAFETWLFYRDWQSPAWLHMKPLGNSPYNSDSAWIRDSVDVSQRALARHSELMWLAIWKRLQNLAGVAHTRIALTGVMSKAEPRDLTPREKGEKSASSSVEPTGDSPSNQNKGEVDIREAAPGVGLPFVDMRKPAGAIARETRRAALAKGAPYRDVPDLDRILKAVEYKKKTGCTYPEASVKEFGNRDRADKIRYWHNKHAHGEQ